MTPDEAQRLLDMAASEEGFIIMENEAPFDCGLCSKWLHFKMCDL